MRKTNKKPYANNLAGKTEAVFVQPQPSARVTKARDGGDLRSAKPSEKKVAR